MITHELIEKWLSGWGHHRAVVSGSTLLEFGEEWRWLGTTYHGGEGGGARRGRMRCTLLIGAEELGYAVHGRWGSAPWCRVVLRSWLGLNGDGWPRLMTRTRACSAWWSAGHGSP
jgi:hypothetical protein